MHNNFLKLFLVVICAVIVAIIPLVLLDNDDDTKIEPNTTSQNEQAKTLEDKYNGSSKETACKSSTKNNDKDSTAYTDKIYAEVCDPDG